MLLPSTNRIARHFHSGHIIHYEPGSVMVPVRSEPWAIAGGGYDIADVVHTLPLGVAGLRILRVVGGHPLYVTCLDPSKRATIFVTTVVPWLQSPKPTPIGLPRKKHIGIEDAGGIELILQLRQRG